MDVFSPSNPLIGTPRKAKKTFFSPILEESPRKISRCGFSIDSPYANRDASLISMSESPGKIRDTFWNTVDISTVSQDNTYLASYDNDGELYEVDECTDAEYFSKGLRPTPLKDRMKSPMTKKSPATKRSEREIFLEAQIMELKRQLQLTNTEKPIAKNLFPPTITYATVSPPTVVKDNNLHVSFNVSEDSQTCCYADTDCDCEDCKVRKQNESLARLITACKSADLEGIVAELDSEAVTVNIQENELGNCPLHFACSHDATGDRRVLQLLLDNFHADPLLTNDLGSTALHYACANNHREAANELLLHFNTRYPLHPNPNPNLREARDKEGKTALFAAAFRGHLELVELLLFDPCLPNYTLQSTHMNKDNARIVYCNVNARSHSNWTPLHCACYGGHQEIAEVLIMTCKADASVMNKAGRTALHYAVESGNADIVRALLSGRTTVDINAVDVLQNSALHIACHKGQFPIAEMLLTLDDIAVDGLNSAGKSCLHYACNNCKKHSPDNSNVNLVKQLLSKGADASEQGCHGLNALHYAAAAGDVRVIRHLLQFGRGVDVLATDEHGYTAVHHALYNHNKRALWYLLRASVRRGTYLFFSGQVLGLFNTLFLITAVSCAAVAVAATLL